MSFERVYSKAPWENSVGYCRAVRAGQHIAVTGTAPIGDDAEVVAPGNARIHAEFFAEHRPATTMVEIARLIDPHMLIEIEADAYLL